MTAEWTPASPTRRPQRSVTTAALIWVGVAVVVLSFVASFLGAMLARSAGGAPEAVAPPIETVAPETPAPTPAPDQGDYDTVLDEILPPGAVVRAGAGAPGERAGTSGDIYLDTRNSDVWVNRDGVWQFAGNLRAEMAENLAGAPGAAGEQGPQGETGEQGAAGAPGTQITLGTGVPDNAQCTGEGDVFIDTEAVQFYECLGGAWALASPEGESAKG